MGNVTPQPYSSLGEEDTTDPIGLEPVDSVFSDLDASKRTVLQFLDSYFQTHESSFYVLQAPRFIEAVRFVDEDGDSIIQLVYSLDVPFENPGPSEKDHIRGILERAAKRLGNFLEKPISISMTIS